MVVFSCNYLGQAHFWHKTLYLRLFFPFFCAKRQGYVGVLLLGAHNLLVYAPVG